jgi:hypothetical protein
MKTAELDGVLLDYWTARADGRTAKIVRPGEKINRMMVDCDTCIALTPGYAKWWQPFHVYWGSAGPIIEREKISIERIGDDATGDRTAYAYTIDAPLDGQHADTALIAAMRAFVSSKFGDEVPDEVQS